MYDVEFYKDKDDKSEIEEYLINLQQKNNKDNRIKFNKITSYIDALKLHGISVGEPYIKHLKRRDMGIKANKKQDIVCMLERQ